MPMNPRTMRPSGGLAQQAPSPVEGIAVVTADLSVDNVSMFSRSTTGYIKATWWDGTFNIFGNGTPSSFIYIEKLAEDSEEHVFRLYPCDASGNTSGDLTAITTSYTAIVELDLRGCSALNSLHFYSPGYLTSLKLGGCTSLTALYLDGHSLTSLDVSGLTSLASLSVSAGALTSLNLTGCDALFTLDCIGNTAPLAIDASNLPSLASMYLFNSSITSVNASGSPVSLLYGYNCPLLTSVDLSVGSPTFNYLVVNLSECSSLVSVRAENCIIGGYFGYYSGSNIIGLNVTNCDLGAAALNQIYSDILPNSGLINVSGNPGVNDDNPAIAASKGYTVFGS